MEERNYYLAFSLVKGIGPKTFANLLKYFKTAEKTWKANPTELKKAGLGDRLIQKFEKARSELDIKNYLEKLKQKKASFIALCDKEYPKLLASIDNPPIILFVKGDISKVSLDKTIGIVGTRKITNYGREVTKLFSNDLASNGFTIVSGLAMGVDSVASESAIEASGKTIAVLGSGVDLCFPSVNKPLYDKILDNNGIIVSEFPLGFSPTKGSFPSRNRIIAGLSKGVLVTEGAQDSGALITADYAFKFNRKVFAIPGPITSSLSVAPLKLIEKGAKLVTSADDILKEFRIQGSELRIKTQNSKVKGETKEEQKILSLLENESLHFDEIVRRLKLEPPLIGSTLSILEVKGIIVKSLEGGFYKII
ncbi:MAG: DNA-processing protein DprA [Patescibacteria group bacterium]|nr:DNA-processing protein DprA [Patescibacteria group bacterium]